jgi:hypothetical protein
MSCTSQAPQLSCRRQATPRRRPRRKMSMKRVAWHWMERNSQSGLTLDGQVLTKWLNSSHFLKTRQRPRPNHFPHLQCSDHSSHPPSTIQTRRLTWRALSNSEKNSQSGLTLDGQVLTKWLNSSQLLKNLPSPIFSKPAISTHNVLTIHPTLYDPNSTSDLAGSFKLRKSN